MWASIASPEQPFFWGSTAMRDFVVLWSPVGIAWVLDNLWALWGGSGHSVDTLHDKMIKGSVYRISSDPEECWNIHSNIPFQFAYLCYAFFYVRI